jgi:ribosomal protein S1
MSEAEKTDPATPPPATPAVSPPSDKAEPAPPAASPTPTAPAKKEDKRRGPGQGKPGKGGGFGMPRRRVLEGVPSLEETQRYGSGPKLKELDDEIAGELEAALGGLSEQQLIGADSSAEARQQAQPGHGSDRKQGKVLAVHGPDVFVDVPGGRSQGVLPMEQFPDEPPKVGTLVEFTIEGYDPANGLLILSRRGAAVVADWSSVAEGMIVEARVLETNKGGLAVDINGIRGFMPISQIDLYRVENAEQFVNQRLRCVVTEVNPEERNLVVSRRALLEKDREEQREKTWAELAEGQVRDGIVRSVRDFGAFVDIGGVDGLLHVSEMSWKRVQKAADIVREGQSVKVVVLKLDREARKVSLGLKQLEASPWDNIEQKYHPLSVVTGTVTRLMDFGAFVELEPGVEGLIHISELARNRVWRVSDVVKPEQQVQVKVLNIDPAARRISLSLKEALPEEKPAAREEEEEEVVKSKPRPRNVPLRGGVGGDTFVMPSEEEEENAS